MVGIKVSIDFISPIKLIFEIAHLTSLTDVTDVDSVIE